MKRVFEIRILKCYLYGFGYPYADGYIIYVYRKTLTIQSYVYIKVRLIAFNYISCK
jgi:hypothetical protein